MTKPRMSLLKYFRPIPSKEPSTPKDRLPDPSGCLSKVMPSPSIMACNAEVTRVLDAESSGTRKPYLKLTPAQRFEIGKKAAEIGATSAMRYFARKYTHLPLTEPTVRRLKNLYLQELKKKPLSADSSDFKELPCKKIGRPLNIGEKIDSQVQAYIKHLRENGAIVNTSIVIAVAKGIIMKDTSLPCVDAMSYLTKDWAKYLMQRMGLVKRRASTKAKVDVKNFDELKGNFLGDIKNVMLMDEIPQELIINFDQTGINYIPISSWTMEEAGKKRVEIIGKDDKRQITAVFGASMSGDFLPVQLVYQGKSKKCLPPFEFPPEWDINFSENHWSNEHTMLCYFRKVVFPYLNKKRAELNLPSDYPALLLFDNFKGQCTNDVLQLLDSHNVNIVIVPANCTD